MRDLAEGLVPDFRFVLDDLTDVPDHELRARRMPADGRLTLWFLKYSRRGRTLLGLLGPWRGVYEELLRMPQGRQFSSTLWAYYLHVAGVPKDDVGKAIAAAWGQEAKEIMMTTAEKLRNEGRIEGKTEGLRLGEAKAILTVLGARDVPVPDDVRQRILECRDLDLLERWIARASKATSVGDVLEE